MFEVNSESFPGWDLQDLETFFTEIGEIQYIKNNGSKTIIIYQRFYDALVAIEFFKNAQNFKEEINKDTFTIDWIQLNNEIGRTFSEEVYSTVFSIYEKFHKYYKDYFLNTNNQMLGMTGGFVGGNFNMPSNYSMQQPMDNNYNWNNNMNYYQNQNQNPNNFYGGNQNNYNKDNKFNSNNNGYNNKFGNNQNNSSSNNQNNNTGVGNDEDTKSGKYTCRFEILIDNDKEFQIARKLIGSKGCNMKKIVESCGSDHNNEVKLRLRGRGSGFKEGPHKLESDEPLHLCVSSKNYEKYQQACDLLEELILTVFDEYKKYCHKTNKIPLQKIYIKKEEGISRKSTQIQGRENTNNNISTNNSVIQNINNTGSGSSNNNAA
jgi:hypothetical protein